jgi:paraquat-inducible protein B
MPLIYQGVTVGQVGQPLVGEDGVSVTAPAVIFAPYDRLVTEATVFWDASGFSLSLAPPGPRWTSTRCRPSSSAASPSTPSSRAPRPGQDGDVFEAYLYEATPATRSTPTRTPPS